MTERHCKHCGYWYPTEDWHEDETHIQAFGGKTIDTLRTVECPGCHSTFDAHDPPLRDRLASDEDERDG